MNFEIEWHSYFGARYYDPNISIWLSVDPLSDKYPSHSPYNYVLNNPIRLVDPDGMMVDEYELNVETGEMKNVAPSDNDVVYAVSPNGEGGTTRTGDKVEFEGKPITENRVLGTSKEGKPEQLIAVSNIADGDKLFGFVKEQTGENQEWSILDYTLNSKSSQSLITTSGLKSSEPRGSSFARQIANTDGASILRFDHNHPDRSTSEWSSTGDRALRDAVLKNNSNASVNIHFKSGAKWTSRSIINDTKHHYRGEFN